MTTNKKKTKNNKVIILPVAHHADKKLQTYLNGKSWQELRFPQVQAVYIQILQDYLDKKISVAMFDSLSEDFLQQVIARNKLRTTLCELLFIAIELNFLSVKFPKELPALNKELKEYLSILRAELVRKKKATKTSSQ